MHIFSVIYALSHNVDKPIYTRLNLLEVIRFYIELLAVELGYVLLKRGNVNLNVYQVECIVLIHYSRFNVSVLLFVMRQFYSFVCIYCVTSKPVKQTFFNIDNL